MKKRAVAAVWAVNFLAFVFVMEFLSNLHGSDIWQFVWLAYMALFLGFLVFYFIKNIIKKKYIPRFDVLTALWFTALSFLLLICFGEYSSSEAFVGFTHFGGLAYRLYTPVAATFLACLLILNVIIYFIKGLEEKKCTN